MTTDPEEPPASDPAPSSGEPLPAATPGDRATFRAEALEPAPPDAARPPLELPAEAAPIDAAGAAIRPTILLDPAQTSGPPTQVLAPPPSEPPARAAMPPTVASLPAPARDIPPTNPSTAVPDGSFRRRIEEPSPPKAPPEAPAAPSSAPSGEHDTKRARRLLKVKDSGRGLAASDAGDTDETRVTERFGAAPEPAPAPPPVSLPLPDPILTTPARAEPPPARRAAGPLPPTRMYDPRGLEVVPGEPPLRHAARRVAHEVTRVVRPIGRGLAPLARPVARALRPSWRRARRLAIGVVLVLATVRVLVALTLGFAADVATRELLGLECRIGASSVSLANGQAVLENVELGPPGGETLARIGRAELDLEWTELPAVVIHRAVLEDVHVVLQRDERGTIRALEDLRRALAKKDGAKPEKDGPPPRVLLEGVRVHDARVEWDDASVSPRVRQTLEVDLRADEVGTLGREKPLHVSLRAAAPGLLDSLRLELAARPWAAERTCDLELELEGHPARLAPYLARAGIRPDAKNVTARLEARFVARPALLGDRPSSTGDLTVERVSVRVDDDELGFDRLVATARRLGLDGVEVSSVACDRPRASLARLADGTVRFAGLVFLPREDEPDGESDRPLALPDFSVDEVAVHEGRFRFRDATTQPAVALDAREIQASLRGLARVAGREPTPARVDASLLVPGLVEKLGVSGTLQPLGPRRRATVQVAGTGVGLAALAPYLARAGLEPELANATLGARVDVELENPARGRGVVTGTVSRLSVSDERERVGIDAVRVTNLAWDVARRSLTIDAVAIEGPRASLERDRAGALRFLGLRRSGRVPAAPRSDGARRGLARFALGRLAVTGLRLGWTDAALASPVELGLEDGSLDVQGLGWVEGTPTERAARLALHARVPRVGVVGLEASALADPAAPAVSATLAASQLDLRPLAPYLARAGIDPALEGGRLDARLAAHATLDERRALREGSASIEGLRLAGPTGDVLALDRLAVLHARVAPDGGAVELGDVSLEGLRARLERDASGGVLACGLRFRARDGAVVASDAPGATAPGAPPRVRWGEVAIRDAALTWRDATTTPPVDVAIRRLDASLGSRHLDTEELGGLPPLERPAPFKLRAEAPGLVEVLELAGGLVPSARAPVLFANLHASGVGLAAVAPYLERASLRPDLAKGELRARVEASASLGRSDLRARTAVRDLVLADEQRELLALDRAEATVELDRAARTLSLGDLTFERPRGLLRRTKEGELAFAGVCLGRAAKPAEPDLEPERAAPTDAPLATTLAGVRATGLGVQWRDERAGVSLDLANGSLELDRATLAANAPSAPFRVHLEAPGTGVLDLAGGVRLSGTAPLASGTIRVAKLNGAALAPYLRERGELHLDDASLAARFAAATWTPERGGRGFGVSVDDLVLENRGRRVLGWSSVRIDAPRIDLRRGAFVIRDVVVENLDAEVERLEGGRLRLPGFTLAARSDAPAPAAPATARAEDAADAPLPYVQVRSASLGVRRLALLDGTGRNAPPLVLQRVSLEMLPFTLAREGRSSSSVVIALSASADQVLERAAATLVAQPFDSEPHATLQVEAAGFSGPALAERLPDLAARWDLSAIPAAQVRGAVTCDLKSRRRLDVLLASPGETPLAFEASLSDFTVKSAPDGPVLLGCDELHVDVASWNLATGEARIRSLDLANPRGRLRRELNGLRFLDAVLLRKPDEGEAPKGSSGGPRPELRIDRAGISDGDVLYEDATVTPECALPFGALEVEVTGLGSRVLDERRPVRVRVGARGGGLFDELVLRGVLTFVPKIDGDVDLTITGLKAARLSGVTRKLWKLDLRDGRIDVEARGRFRNGRLQSLTRITCTEVQSEEPSDGFLVRKAGISLKTALAAIRNEQDVAVLEIPLNLDFDENLHVVGQELDVGSIIADALAKTLKGIATAPLGAMERFGKQLGKAMGGADEPEGRREVAVAFSPAEARLGKEGETELDAIVARALADSTQHVLLRAEVGARDEERAQRLAAPTRDERLDLVARLEVRRRRLERRRADSEAEVRGALLAGSDELGAARARLQAAARAVQEVDRVLDGLYDQEREGRGKSQERRVAEVSEGLCDARVEAVRAHLVARGVSIDQIRVLRPRLRASEAEGAPGVVRVEVAAGK